MTDRTAAALASALPLEIDDYDITSLAAWQAERLTESGWRLVHADDRPQTFTEHYAQALALIHDHVEGGDALAPVADPDPHTTSDEEQP